MSVQADHDDLDYEAEVDQLEGAVPGLCKLLDGVRLRVAMRACMLYLLVRARACGHRVDRLKTIADVAFDTFGELSPERAEGLLEEFKRRADLL